MKPIILFVLLLLCSVSLLAEPLPFVAPQFLQSYYDHFSNNYLNALAAGRGHTGVGLEGNIENSLQNPAAFKTDHSHMHFEIFLKPPVKEMDKWHEQHYESLTPIGMWAYGITAGQNFCLGATYSIPQSIEYNVFSVDLPTGDVVLRYPSYTQYQVALTGNYQYRDFRFGLNILNNVYRFKDQITIGTALFDRVDHVDYALRFQPGILYTHKAVSVGSSYMPSTKHQFDFRYQTFDTTLPSQLNAGVGVNLETTRIASDVNLLKCSEMSDKFKDRLTIKAGIETDYRKYTLRGGFMSVPGVWSGINQLPSYWAPLGQSFTQPDSLGLYESASQSMITGGFTWHSELVDLTLAFIQDIQKNANYTSVFGSMSINISKFSFRRSIPVEKEKEVPVEDDTEIEYLE